MKKIILMLALMCILCTSCARVVTADYYEIFSGMISKLDEKSNQIEITNAKGDTKTWSSDDMEDDLLYSYMVDDDFVVGDDVYVYSNDGDILISKVSVVDAKKINDYLFGLISFKALGIFLLVVIAVAFICGKISNKLRYANSSTFVSVLALWGELLLCACMFVTLTALCYSGCRLWYNGDGVIKEVVDDKITLENGRSFKVLDMRYLTDEGEMAKVGDKVDVYCYSSVSKEEGTKDDGYFLLANKKITEATIRTEQTYPLFNVYSILLILVYGVIGFFVRIAVDENW